MLTRTTNENLKRLCKKKEKGKKGADLWNCFFPAVFEHWAFWSFFSIPPKLADGVELVQKKEPLRFGVGPDK